jgi:DNA-binding response OmpR family regulator
MNADKKRKRLEGRSILVVDDEPDLREIVAEELAVEGARVRQAGSGNEALALLRREPAALVVSDIRMPGGDGVFLLRELKKEDVNAPVVMLMTGFADLSVIDAFDLGAEAYYAKPFHLEEVLRSAERLLEDRAERLRQPPAPGRGEAVTLELPGLQEALSSGALRFGRGGIFVATEEVPEKAGAVDLRISFSGGNDEAFCGHGMVRWRRKQEKAQSEGTRPGFGLELLGLGPAALERFLATTGEENPRAYIPKG